MWNAVIKQVIQQQWDNEIKGVIMACMSDQDWGLMNAHRIAREFRKLSVWTAQMGDPIKMNHKKVGCKDRRNIEPV